RLLRIEQLSGDGGSSPVAGNPSSSIVEWHACLPTQERNQCSVEVLRRNRLTAKTEEHCDGLAGLSIGELGLDWTRLLPGGDGLADERIDWLCVGGPGLVGWHIEQAGCIFPRHVRRGGGGTRSTSLPANASHTQAHELVAAKASKEPGQCQCSNERSGIH